MTPEQKAEIEALCREYVELKAQLWVLKWKRGLCISGDCQEPPERERGVAMLLCTKHAFELEFAEALRSGPDMAEPDSISKSR